MNYPELPESLQRVEEDVLERWRDEDLFRATLEANADGEPFVFYEGPPTANGRPGLHHIISRTIKDLVCRYRAMEGRQVTRIAGWDTHGLPVEIEAEKKLGISGKPEIEAVGIAEFNEVCRDSVFTYKEEWENLSERIGYWLEYWRPYVTFHTDYIESVWWVLKQLSEKDLLYRGHKSVPYCPRCGTALSSHEVAQGYQDVEDPSLTFLGELLDGEGEPDGRAFLVWTTTPWTVPSNTGMAVNPELTYAQVERDGRQLIVAEGRVEHYFGEEARVTGTYLGSELAGLRYRRPLELAPAPDDPENGWTVVAEDFVSADEGTGIVHMAPAFGADDYAAGQRHGLPMMNPLDDAGRFVEAVEVVGGMFVKDADPLVVEELKKVDRLFDIRRMTHSYPHCWRCDSPLLYVAHDTWFAATSTLKDRLLANNEEVSWHPPEVGEKRFGDWLRGNVDWALSRDRYWGTPLPVWVCDADEEHVRWVGSLDELGELAGGLDDDFDPHRPFIDELTWACSSCEGTMRRSESVLDVWFDSGAMPYAQWHYPFEHEDEFEAHFPADFICEGLDQTRGWFYSLMAIGTMLGRGPAYRNVVVNDLVLDAEGQKMSKSKGNTVNPWDAIDAHGTDALRWYFITSSNPWVPKRFDPEGVDEAARRFLDTLFNTYRFFRMYAEVEGWSAGEADPAATERPLLDRWLLSRLDSVVAEVREELDGYELTKAYRALGDFVVEDLSNWYVRRNRARFWGNTDEADARAAFRTLWEALRTVALVLGPVTPFVADWLHRALTGESVHLARFPRVHGAAGDDVDAGGGRGLGRDEALEADMEAARTLVSLGRAAREEVQIRVRQPLRALHAVLPGGRTLAGEILAVVEEELNVKGVEFLDAAEELVRFSAKPNFAALGPRFGSDTPKAAEAIRGLGQDALTRFRNGEEIHVEVAGTTHTVQRDDLEILQEAPGELVARTQGRYTVALDPTLDAGLRAEGMARELVNRVQRLRKNAGLEITDRIELGIQGPPEVTEAARTFTDFIAGEVLATTLVAEEGAADGFQESRAVDLDGTPARIGLRVAEG